MWTPKFCGEHSCHGIAVQMRAELNQQEKSRREIQPRFDGDKRREKSIQPRFDGRYWSSSFRPSDVPKKSNFSWIFLVTDSR